MSPALQLALAGMRRRSAHTATQVIVLAAAVALLGAMILFIGHSLRTMTASATRSVPLDLQGPVASYDQARSISSAVARQPDIAQATATATAPFAGITHQGSAGVTSAGQGYVLAVDPGYLRSFQTFRFLRGSQRAGQVVLDQQLAATLQAQIGDTIALRAAANAPPQRFKVSGVALVTAPDVLFQPLNPLLGPAPAQPPSNVAILPLTTFAQTLARQLSALPGAGLGASAVPGSQTGIQWQVQAQVDPTALSGTPGHAFTRAGQIRNAVERKLPGKLQFVDNLSADLNTAAEDALYVDALFVMLAIPGAILAMGLVYLSALGTVDRDRRELALLRARGASRRQLLGLAGAEAAIVGMVAGLLGAGLAFAAVGLLIKGSIGLTLGRALGAIGACVLLAVAGATAARFATALRALSSTVTEGRRSVLRSGRPLWQRLYLDLIALVLSGLIYWLTASTGFSAVVNPDSNPTLSLSIYMFFAPALLWIGATLLMLRLRGRAVAAVARRLGERGRPSGRRGFLLASASRRGESINRGLVLVGLLLAFGVSLGVFTATYDQQSAVDSQLTLGADVTATAPPGVAAKTGLAARIAKVPGVTATTALDHSYAYVGPDLQDTFGIDASTIGKATTLRNSYFVGSSAETALRRLQRRPDGILVSKETITDYSLGLGDLLRLRVLDHRSGRFRAVDFHVVGIVQEFPSAPRDSFMVANLGYLQSADHAGGPKVVFAKAGGDPTGVAARVANATRGDGVIVKDVRRQSAATVSSITAVDLSGISRLEEAFTILLAATAMWLFVSLIVSERRHEFATMAAVGASLKDIAGFIRSEAIAVLTAAIALAALLGWLLSEMLVAMLQHVFDPPPDHLAVPWSYLGELGLAGILGGLLAVALAARRLRRLPIGAALREQ
ncbi:MAG TPA: ABC transporter permease [Solirubrobacteraceae bacterium]|nr:ABC transporter permease [Solirubrobacteraceae bacterium]